MKTKNHGIDRLALLFLVVLPPYVAAQDSFFGNAGEKFAPSTIIIIITAVIFGLTAFLALFLRQFSEGCFGLDTAPPNPNVTADGRVVKRGLDADVIKSLPTYFYSNVKEHRKGKVELECAVCLSEFLDNEALRLLPGCSHVFHPRCIDQWLLAHVTCPICRQNLERGLDDVAKEHFVSISLTHDEPDDCRDAMCLDHHDDGKEKKETEEKNMVGTFDKFSRSHSTGHSMAERFTLRLPEEIHNNLVNRSSYEGKALTSIPSSTSAYK